MKTEPTEALRHIRTCIGANVDTAMSTITRYDASIAAKIAFQEGQSSLKIKQLEWVEDCGGVMAETPFLKYLVLIIGGKVGLRFDGNDEFLKFRTIDEAKAAAQADFERRVMECLDLKAQQKQALIDMMLGDEELGLYDNKTSN